MAKTNAKDEYVINNYHSVLYRLRQYPKAKLIVVTKNHDFGRISTLLDKGQIDFGENKLQEAQKKWQDYLQNFNKLFTNNKSPINSPKLHFLGRIQSNKVKQICFLFDYIHSLDREKIAKQLKDIQLQGDKLPKLFIQVNTGLEPQKSGVNLELADNFIEYCLDLKLPVIGLMSIPPVNSEKNWHYSKLKEIADRHGLTQLSMGMSDDFEIALNNGATFIRVGSKILGSRIA